MYLCRYRIFLIYTDVSTYIDITIQIQYVFKYIKYLCIYVYPIYIYVWIYIYIYSIYKSVRLCPECFHSCATSQAFPTNQSGECWTNSQLLPSTKLKENTKCIIYRK